MKNQKIKEVTFIPIRPTEKGLIGFASCLFDKLALSSIAIYTKPNGNGIRCLFPSKKLPNGKDINVFFPIDKETNELITNAIAEKIKEVNEKVKEKKNELRSKND